MVFRTIAGNTLQYLIPQKCIKRALEDCSVLLDKNWQSVSEWVWSVDIFMYLLFLWIVLHITVMDVSSSGWTAFKDEGSTEPDHSPATIHNQSGKFSVEVGLILWKLLHFPNLSVKYWQRSWWLLMYNACVITGKPQEVKENIASFGTNGQYKKYIYFSLMRTPACALPTSVGSVKVYDLPYAKFA